MLHCDLVKTHTLQFCGLLCEQPATRPAEGRRGNRSPGFHVCCLAAGASGAPRESLRGLCKVGVAGLLAREWDFPCAQEEIENEKPWREGIGMSLA